MNKLADSIMLQLLDDVNTDLTCLGIAVPNILRIPYTNTEIIQFIA